MKLISASYILLLALQSTPLWAGSYDTATFASIIDVLATPERFQGKKVMLTGWITSINDQYALCQNKHPNSNVKCLWLDVESTESIGLGAKSPQQRKKLIAQFNGRLLSLFATFDTNNTGSLYQISGGLVAITGLRSH